MWVVETDLVFVSGKEITCFNVSMENDLNLVWVVQIDLISVSGIELDLGPV